MANALYPLWKQSVMSEADTNKSLDQSGANACFAALVSLTAGYTYSASHQFYSSISTFIQGTPQQITSPTIVTGIFDGGDVSYSNVTGSTVGAVVIYRANAGANTTWRLVCYLDTAIVSFPMTPNGANINIQWNAQGIFQS